MKQLIVAALLSTAGLAETGREASVKTKEGSEQIRIRIDLDGRALTATLEDNAAARDFASMLPMTLTLKDYNATEKISDFPKKLATEGAPPGIDPEVGDITYYAPWGNLALFYKDFGYSRGLVKLGRIDSGVEALSGPGPFQAKIELIGTRKKNAQKRSRRRVTR